MASGLNEKLDALSTFHDLSFAMLLEIPQCLRNNSTIKAMEGLTLSVITVRDLVDRAHRVAAARRPHPLLNVGRPATRLAPLYARSFV